MTRRKRIACSYNNLIDKDKNNVCVCVCVCVINRLTPIPPKRLPFPSYFLLERERERESIYCIFSSLISDQFGKINYGNINKRIWLIMKLLLTDYKKKFDYSTSI